MALRGTQQRPDGLVYDPAFLAPAEADDLMGHLTGLALEPVVIQGNPSRRLVAHFGVGYDFDRRSTVGREAAPIPPYLLGLRGRCASLAAVAEDSLREALVTRYPVGSTIGWHRDAPPFGSHVIGVSLVADSVMQFQRRAAGGQRLVFEQPLAAGSAYVLAGAARYSWQHRIPPVREERWSVTFRQLREADESAHVLPDN